MEANVLRYPSEERTTDRPEFLVTGGKIIMKLTKKRVTDLQRFGFAFLCFLLAKQGTQIGDSPDDREKQRPSSVGRNILRT